MASLVHYSKAHLSKVERGLKEPSQDLARLCDAELCAHGELASLAADRRKAAHGCPDLRSCGLSRAEETTGEDPARDRLATRRQVLAAGILTIPGVGIITRTDSERTDNTIIVDSFRSIFDHYRQLGQISDPELLIHPLIAQNALLQELLKAASLKSRNKMLILSSRYAEYIGWLFQESGDDAGALRWTSQAADLAGAGGDPEFASYGLVRHALVTMYQGDAARTTSLSQRARALGPPPRIAGLAALREAQGYALAGDHTASMRAVDRAGALLGRVGISGDEPVIGSSNLSDPAEVVRGWCLHDLGRPAEAAEVLGAQLLRIPRSATRTRARFGIRRALACAAAGEVEQACACVSGLLDGEGIPGSATIAKDLRTLSRVLARHPKSPPVRDLAPRLAAALHAAS
ncbi:MAG: transcriptional regulator [Streptosporangiales bacterium]|jgi:hypothetical protein|nr:transcriptional regulator [Streptosporangiales bacterium]